MEPSCKEKLGEKKAAELVKQCLQISPSTWPPCHEFNPCSVIKNEIAYGCRYDVDMRETYYTPSKPPAFCAAYLNKK